jgi:signal transduction histidine kinase
MASLLRRGESVESGDLTDIDRYIARARTVLSLLALVSIYLDPVVGGPFTLELLALVVLGLHLAYSVATMLLTAHFGSSPRAARMCEALDVLFATAVALVTEGLNSPSYVFFCFAIVAAGCREGLRATLRITLASMVLYSASMLLLDEAGRSYVMRPAYLGLIGCLVGFLGQQRLSFERQIRELETAAQRHAIARSLHDGYVQALAGVNLKLETCRELLVRAEPTAALDGLEELQAGVAREYDEVRAFIRKLADAPVPKSRPGPLALDTLFHLRVEVDAKGELTEQVLQILLEAVRNCRQHGKARSAEVRATTMPEVVNIAIVDDGVGFGPSATAPWSIASRVAESGGRLTIFPRDVPGANLHIELPIG